MIFLQRGCGMNEERVNRIEQDIERVFGFKAKINDNSYGDQVICINLPTITRQAIGEDGTIVFIKTIGSFFKDNIYVKKLINTLEQENSKMQSEIEELKKYKIHFDLEKELRGVK